MKKRIKGFTLIELLAVIVILAVILLIVVPIVLNVIGDSRKGAFESSAMGLVKTAENACMSYALRHDPVARETFFTDGEMTGDELNFTGKPPVGGYVYINEQCEIQLAVHNNEWCAIQNYEELKVILVPYDGECGFEKNPGSGTAEDPYNIYTWEDLHNVRYELDAYYYLRNDLDQNTEGYEDYVANMSINIIDRVLKPGGWGSYWNNGDTINFAFVPEEVNEIVSISWGGNNYNYSVDYELGIITLLENTSQRNLFIEYDVNFPTGWVPISFKNHELEIFTGNFNGGNNVIKDLFMYNPRASAGLFYQIENATIKNLGLENVDIMGGAGTAGLVSFSLDSTIENAYAVGSIEGSDYYVGGLIGYYEIWNCLTCVIDGVYTKGEVINTVDSGINGVGGIVGYSYGSVLLNSYSESNVVAAAGNAGGLAGYVNNARIYNSYATGNVTGEDFVGGIVGFLGFNSELEKCYATGSVTGENFVGGLAGLSDSTRVSNSYFKGSVEAIIDSAGGIIGYAIDDEIENTYAAGTVISGGSDAGGLVGTPDNQQAIINSYFSISANNGIGSFRSEEDMIFPYNFSNTYLNWDFETIWNINAVDNDGYPFLR